AEHAAVQLHAPLGAATRLEAGPVPLALGDHSEAHQDRRLRVGERLLHHPDAARRQRGPPSGIAGVIAWDSSARRRSRSGTTSRLATMILGRLHERPMSVLRSAKMERVSEVLQLSVI